MGWNLQKFKQLCFHWTISNSHERESFLIVLFQATSFYKRKTHIEFHSRGQDFCKNFYDINYQINKDQFL